MKKNIAILISGRGSNMQHLVNLSEDDDCPFRVALVV
jgi:folate-dependent phosphoribosylglycinamide formyltransferase PurN